MPATKLILRPGVNTEYTPLLNETAISFSNCIRWFEGLLQKLGGWLALVSTPLIGTCRGMLAWADLTGVPYVACGTEQRLQVYSGGQIYDITPIVATTNPDMPFSTTDHSTTVKVTDNTNGSSVGDWIYIATLVSTPAGILQGFYQVVTEIDANNYDIVVASAASSTSSGVGTTSLFTTTNGSPTVQVTLDGNGYVVNSVYTVAVSTTVGGLTINGSYLVASIIDANNFTITAVGGATSGATAYENSGDTRIEYLLPTGLVSAATAGGYGEGGYGLGPYGQGGTTTAYSALRQWTMGSWGEQLIACPTQETIYFWDPSAGLIDNPAVGIENAPSINTGVFIAMPQQQIVAYGITNPSTSLQDPMLVGWCDVADYTDWTATVTNQAGTFRLPVGSRIVGGLQGPQYGVLWTDLGVWLMQYIGYPLVYGFNNIGQGCGLIAMRACCVLGGNIYWMSQKQFYVFNGNTVQALQCAVWDIIFDNLTQFQQDKITMGGDSQFNEFFVFFPSISGTGENDTYVKCNVTGNLWDYGSLIRTAWIDQTVLGNPLAVDGSAIIQQHEVGNDANGTPMASTATTGFFKISDGLLYIFIDRFIPDFVLTTGTNIQITVFMVDYPDDTPRQYGPYTINSTTKYINVRGRGRLAQVQFTSDAIGSFYRLGEMIYFGTPSGRR